MLRHNVDRSVIVDDCCHLHVFFKLLEEEIVVRVLDAHHALALDRPMVPVRASERSDDPLNHGHLVVLVAQALLNRKTCRSS